MKKTFVIVSVSSRVNDLNALIASIIARSKFEDYDIQLLFQDPFKVADRIQYRDRYKNIITVNNLLGCHAARVLLLRETKEYDVYINLDDDMELLDVTDYELPIQKCMEKGTGFVLTNWARTLALVEEKIPKMKPRFVKQVLVYQGGGMVYSEKVAALMRELAPLSLTFDTSWPLTAYLKGFTNYRFLGSLAVHRVCTTGGMSSFMRGNPAAVALTPYVNYRAAKRVTGSGMDLLIPLDSDLKPLAHETHRKNRENLCASS